MYLIRCYRHGKTSYIHQKTFLDYTTARQQASKLLAYGSVVDFDIIWGKQ